MVGSQIEFKMLQTRITPFGKPFESLKAVSLSKASGPEQVEGDTVTLFST